MSNQAVVTSIDPRALQLTQILLRQYHPKVAKLLPKLKTISFDGIDINLDITPENISRIISALNQIGEQWLKEKPKNPGEVVRNYHRKSCLSYLLGEWIRAAENSQRYLKNTLH